MQIAEESVNYISHEISTLIVFARCVKDSKKRVLMEQVLNVLNKHNILMKLVGRSFGKIDT